jgi:cell division septation protein DedD
VRYFGPRSGASSLTAWIITLLLALIAGLTSYQLGRDWLGPTLRQIVPGEEASSPAPLERPAEERLAETEEIPDEAVIETYPREPTVVEQQGLESDLAQSAAESQVEIPEAARTAEASNDSAASGPQAYIVVAGSFSSRENAQRRVDELVELGHHPFTEPHEIDGQTRFRVVVGLFGDKQDAEEVSQALEQEQIESIVYSR